MLSDGLSYLISDKDVIEMSLYVGDSKIMHVYIEETELNMQMISDIEISEKKMMIPQEQER